MTTQTQPPAAGEAAHTPTPWKIERNGYGPLDIHAEYIPHGRVAVIAQQFPQDDGQRDGALEEANAAFIVRACNSHAALIEALSQVLALCDDADADQMTQAAADVARAALNLAQS